MAKREGELKATFVRELRRQLPGLVVLAHQDIRTVGIPDLSVTGNGRTSWLEFKHGNPHFASQGYQELTCMRLAAGGFCRYVIFHENADGTAKRTMIVHPKMLKEMIPESFTTGFNHKWLCEWVREVHWGNDHE